MKAFVVASFGGCLGVVAIAIVFRVIELLLTTAFIFRPLPYGACFEGEFDLAWARLFHTLLLRTLAKCLIPEEFWLMAVWAHHLIHLWAHNFAMFKEATVHDV